MVAIAFVAALALALFGDVPGERPVVPPPVATASLGPTIDQPTAIQFARDFFLHRTSALRSGLRMVDVTVGEVWYGTDLRGRPAWRVQISGEVEEIGVPAPGLHTVLWVSVDAETGEVRVLAVG